MTNKINIGGSRLRFRVCIFLFFLIFALSGRECAAKIETRDVVWKWKIYSCDHGCGDFMSPEQALAERNALIDGYYNKCMDSDAVTPCIGSGCSKENYYNLVPGAAGVIVNGIPTFQQTKVHRSTSFVVGCYGDVGKSYVVEDSAPIAVSGSFSCPSYGGWEMRSGNYKSVNVNGAQISSYSVWCEAEVSDPPVCKDVYGDPISPVDKTVVEHEVDYTSFDGLLRVERFYTSSGGGRWSWGGVILAY